MTATIKSIFASSPTTLAIRSALTVDESVFVAIHNEPDVIVARSDFLAAVETECGVRIVPADAIVIDRADVERETLIDAICSQTAYSAVSRHDRGAVGNAVDAIYRTLAARPLAPPVSDEDVETLAGLLWEYAQNPSGPGDSFDETNKAERNRFRNRAHRVLTGHGPNGERVTIARGESS